MHFVHAWQIVVILCVCGSTYAYFHKEDIRKTYIYMCTSYTYIYILYIYYIYAYFHKEDIPT